MPSCRGVPKQQTYSDTAATQNIPAHHNVPTNQNVPKSPLAPLDCPCAEISIFFGKIEWSINSEPRRAGDN